MRERELNYAEKRAVDERKKAYKKEIKPYIPQIDEIIDLIVKRTRDESVQFTAPKMTEFDPFIWDAEWEVRCQAIIHEIGRDAQVTVTEDIIHDDAKSTRAIYLERISDKHGELQYGLVIRQVDFNMRNLAGLMQANPFGEELKGESWFCEGFVEGQGFPNYPKVKMGKEVLAEFKTHIESWNPVGDKKGVGVWVSSFWQPTGQGS